MVWESTLGEVIPSMTDDLDALVMRARHGDREAYDRVVELCWSDIYAFTAARAATAEAADAAVQDTFVEAWLALPRYEEQGVFPGWLKGIARNQLRRRRRDTGAAGLDDLADLIGARLDQDEEAAEAAAALVDRLRRCMDALPPHLRILARKRFAEDLPLATLCQHLRRTRASIANALTRIRQSLRVCAEERTT
jgi:RNA polymerase sigma-70 factor (ECF subfamily)